MQGDYAEGENAGEQLMHSLSSIPVFLQVLFEKLPLYSRISFASKAAKKHAFSAFLCIVNIN